MVKLILDAYPQAALLKDWNHQVAIDIAKTKRVSIKTIEALQLITSESFPDLEDLQNLHSSNNSFPESNDSFVFDNVVYDEEKNISNTAQLNIKELKRIIDELKEDNSKLNLEMEKLQSDLEKALQLLGVHQIPFTR